MKGKLLIVPLLAALAISGVAGTALARSPYVPNYFSYDPDYKGDLPKIGGYCDVYWTFSRNLDGQYNALDAEKFDFTVDRAEIFLQHRVTDWADGYFEFSITGVSNDTEINMDEVWLRVVVPIGNGLTLLGGVYDVPIGIGANENIDIWNWQFKMVNRLVAPWSFTGAMAEYEIGDVNINFWIANDWGYSEAYGDPHAIQGVSRTGRFDPDTDKVFGGRIGFSPGEKFDLGVSTGWGNERLPVEMGGSGRWQSRTMVDMDFRWLDLPDWAGAIDFELWWLGLTDQLTPDGSTIENAQAYGGVFQFNYQTPWDVLSVSLGYEVVHEEDGIVFGKAPIGAPDRSDPSTWVRAVGDQTRQSVELTPIFAIGDHVILALTFRTDWSSEDVFVNKDGQLRDFSFVNAVEWYYYF